MEFDFDWKTTCGFNHRLRIIVQRHEIVLRRYVDNWLEPKGGVGLTWKGDSSIPIQEFLRFAAVVNRIARILVLL